MKPHLEILPPYAGTRILPIGRTEDGQAYDIVAEVPMGGGVTGDTEGERIARLFCAAPDLLEALEKCLESGQLSPLSPVLIREVRAAIVKATLPR